MSGTETEQLPSSDREMILTRVVKASLERTWSAWTDAEHLAHWYGPDGFSITTSEFSFRLGGIWRFTMHGPDGRDYPNWIRYSEIIEHERLRLDHGADTQEVLFEQEISFKREGDSTRVTLRCIFPTAEGLAYVVREHGAIEGGKQTLGKLADYVSRL